MGRGSLWYGFLEFTACRPNTPWTAHEDRTVLAAFLALVAGVSGARAQPEDAAAYPSRTVRLIVPAAPGGPIDAVARIMADAFEAPGRCRWWSRTSPAPAPRPAASSSRSRRPDGYTLLVNPDSIAVNPSLYPNLAYDPIKSFEPVSLLMTATQVLVVRPDLGVTDLKSFIDLAKSKHAGLNIASAGAGTISHLTGVLLEQRSGFKTTHVPFRGAAPALSAMLGGHVDGMWVMLAPAVPHLRSGKLKAVAVTAAQRDPELPAVPTAAESGVERFSGRELAGPVRAGRHAEADRRQDRAHRGRGAEEAGDRRPDALARLRAARRQRRGGD